MKKNGEKESAVSSGLKYGPSALWVVALLSPSEHVMQTSVWDCYPSNHRILSVPGRVIEVIGLPESVCGIFIHMLVLIMLPICLLYMF